ncbi:MAG UNVERIFIED_CONTAM: hypothetical protein LVR29_12750 [Microcystis novacekii LVE1205-3]
MTIWLTDHPLPSAFYPQDAIAPAPTARSDRPLPFYFLHRSRKDQVGDRGLPSQILGLWSDNSYHGLHPTFGV